MPRGRYLLAILVVIIAIIVVGYSSTRAQPTEPWSQQPISPQGIAVTPDPFEPDDTCAQASFIRVNGSPQRHNFHVSTDMDWVKFRANAGETYIIETMDLDNRADTVLVLVAPDCTTWLALDDDSGVGLASRIEWTAPASGTYYVLVQPFSSWNTGEESGYTLSVSTPGGGGTCFRTLRGIVYHDANKDGARSPSEGGMGGIVVRMIGPVTRAIISRDNGTYGFAGFPPGDYEITIDVPPEIESTTSITLPVQVGEDRCWYSADYDFGLVERPGALFAFVPHPIIIDGEMDPIWESAPTYPVQWIIWGGRRSWGDLDATFKGLWNADYLYLLVRVEDEALVSDSPDTLWNDDGIEIYLDIDNDKRAPFDANDYQYVFRLGDSSVYETKHNNTAGVEFYLKTYAWGYILEAAFPWTTLKDAHFPFT